VHLGPIGDFLTLVNPRGSCQPTFTAPFAVTKTPASPRPLKHGSPEELAADLRRYQVLGVQDLNINLPGSVISEQIEAMEQFAREVLPLLS
jgi:hypothetical protein